MAITSTDTTRLPSPKERIVYLYATVPAVTELIIAELLYLQYEDPENRLKIYINSTGTSSYNGEPIGFETEAFAICTR